MNSTLKIPTLALALTSCAAAPENYSDRLSNWKRINDEREDARESSAALSVDTSLPDLLAHARAHNPGLEAAFLRWKASLERIPQADTLPNPRVSFSGYLSEVETRVGPMQARVGVSQPFPWFGERELKGEVAFEASEESRELLEAKRLELEHSVRAAWSEFAWVEKAILITNENRELLGHWENVALSRMETGLGSHADVIRAQVELGKLQDRVQTLEDLRRPLVAQLNVALGRSAHETLPSPRLPLPLPPALDEKRLLAELAQTSPVLRALEHRIEGARRGADLADKAFYPDFFVGADYTFIGSADAPGVSGSGDDAIALTLGFDLPLWRSSYRAGGARSGSAHEGCAQGSRRRTQSSCGATRDGAVQVSRREPSREVVHRRTHPQGRGVGSCARHGLPIGR